MIKVTITSTDIRNMSGVGKESGKPYDLHFQTIWVHLVDREGNAQPYPQKTEVMLEKTPGGAVLPFPVGEYTTAPGSVQLDRGGRLTFSPVLVPLKKSASTPSSITA